MSKEVTRRGRWGLGHLFGNGEPSSGSDDEGNSPTKWSMGVLNDPKTVEVPGSILLLASDRNEPLGLRNVNARTSHSSLPVNFPFEGPMTPGGTRPMSATPPIYKKAADEIEDKKRTADGTIILEPQPEESVNDPLNWPTWRRDAALLSLGFYCMLGGGMTPIIAAGFTNVAKDYDVSVEKVALSTGLYMMGLGVGSVFASPTAILFGKRPVYLVSAIIFIGSSLWAGFSPNFPSLLAARVLQGIAVSPVECLPSATIAEIFFLHERAYRIGIYTLLLLGGKNIVPLVSAAIIGRFGWRWTFYIVAIVVAFSFFLLFLFVPETFWDRTPTRRHSISSKRPSRRPSFLRRLSSRHAEVVHGQSVPATPGGKFSERPPSPGVAERHKDLHVGFASTSSSEKPHIAQDDAEGHPDTVVPHGSGRPEIELAPAPKDEGISANPAPLGEATKMAESVGISPAHIAFPQASHPTNQDIQISRSPYIQDATGSSTHVDYFSRGSHFDAEKLGSSNFVAPPKIQAYTHNLRQQPAQSFAQQLRPYHGRLNNDNWFKVMLRPFILFAYPAILWSSVIYACSIGWLIVMSETLAIIFRNPETYNFTALQTGLVYISPFVGGILGTGVAGKISDIIVRAMARRNGGLYEPEFRLVMAGPILITTCIGLIGFGWASQEKDSWIVPTIFFGIVSFGCSLGSTTSITFCVDSYRQYAGEALVTLNFSKNIFHGLVFSLFVSHWLAHDGPKRGLDLDNLSGTGRFTFVDGLTGIFTGNKPPGPVIRGKEGRVLRSDQLKDVKREIEAALGDVRTGKKVLIVDAVDEWLAVSGDEGMSGLAVENMLLSLRENVHTTILTLPTDAPLLHSQATTLERSHAALVLSQAHAADAVISLRMLDTGVARDVSGVMRISVRSDGGVRGEDKAREGGGVEYLYYVGGMEV
ncbi:putative MFS-type transporter [Cladobotryum mycophilum]|uniref:MFS-type transporter n=1 Tax=Cladobotryum mycophilum TaxID=491253 RepID=A0ABR0T339_9HYPO